MQELARERKKFLKKIICCRSGCTLYADAALTQPIDDTVSIDTNGEEMTVYVVPDAPMN